MRAVALLVLMLAAPALAADPPRRSFYVDMRDGVGIAVDLYLPGQASEGSRVPAILRMTRYWRAARFRTLVRPILDEPQPLAQRFLAEGYAWLDVDVRGSGASGGVQRSLWSDEEVADGGELVDWIVRQPWSNGAVGALGDSYDGTAAELLLVNRRPAVKAVAPRFALWDAYEDIGYPGGVHLFWFTQTWGRFNDAIDRGRLGAAFPWWVPIFISGPRPVDGPDGSHAVAAAQRAHEANFDVHAAALEAPFRDDVVASTGLAIDDWSPHGARRAAVEASGAAVFSYSGWWDGAYANAATRRFRGLSNPGSRLLVGPWNHGGDQTLDPLEATRASDFDHAAELLRFFDPHLKGAANGADAEPRVRWFTTGAKRWNEAASWPPPAEPRRVYLAPERTLATDPTTGTGATSRWRGLAVPTWTEYGDRAVADERLVVYETEPLERDTEVTGHPRVSLAVRCDQPDGALFAYLEDVDPRGRVGYVSEGWLRALHRKEPRTFRRADARPLVPGERAVLVFELLPLSHAFRRGHRIRLALAGADADAFAPPADPPPVWTIEAGPDSFLDLPVVRSADPALP